MRAKDLGFSCLILPAMALSAVAQQAGDSGVVAAPTHATISVTVSAPNPSPATVVAPALLEWTEVKDTTFEMRDQLLAALQQRKEWLDREYGELLAKRAATTGAGQATKLDAALKELNTALFFLVTLGDDLTRATPDNWEQRKEKVGLVWKKTEEARIRARALVAG